MIDSEFAKAGIFKRLVELRRDFHKYPESAWTEFRTAALVAKELTELGYELTLGEQATKKEYMMGVPDERVLADHQERAVRQGADSEFVTRMTGGHTGLWADLKCGEGPTIALRFDMDANDIMESQDSNHGPCAQGFASCNKGVMHACGHDGHTAVGLVVAELLAKHKSDLRGTIRLIFQPAEEGVRGARAMVAAGAVNNVDFIIGFHLGFQAERTGVLVAGTKDFLATSKLNVWYEGAPAHAGAYPEKGKNAMLAACSAVLNLHAISRHSGGATRITVGTLNAGQGRNVIPPNAFFELETRG
jgi:aminobenzoyl-glutamate utilization protein A